MISFKGISPESITDDIVDKENVLVWDNITTFSIDVTDLR